MESAFPVASRLSRLFLTALTTEAIDEAIHVIVAERHIEMSPGIERDIPEITCAHILHAHNAPNATVRVPQPPADIHSRLAGWTVRSGAKQHYVSTRVRGDFEEPS